MNISVLLGKTLRAIERNGDEQLVFVVDDSEKYVMYHAQGCCESVHLEDVTGELNDLVGSPILEAEEADNDFPAPKGEYVDSYTWTFYKLGTIKGRVTLRWLGESNGCYSESVDFERCAK